MKTIRFDGSGLILARSRLPKTIPHRDAFPGVSHASSLLRRRYHGKLQRHFARRLEAFCSPRFFKSAAFISLHGRVFRRRPTPFSVFPRSAGWRARSHGHAGRTSPVFVCFHWFFDEPMRVLYSRRPLSLQLLSAISFPQLGRV